MSTQYAGRYDFERTDYKACIIRITLIDKKYYKMAFIGMSKNSNQSKAILMNDLLDLMVDQEKNIKLEYDVGDNSVIASVDGTTIDYIYYLKFYEEEIDSNA